MLGAALIRYQVVQVRQPCEKCLLAPVRMVEAFHHKQLSVDRVMGLIQQGAGHRYTGVFEHRIPARFLGLEPLLHAFAVGRSSRVGDVLRNAAQLLAECKHTSTFALAPLVK
jgi:hypothetical protein